MSFIKSVKKTAHGIELINYDGADLKPEPIQQFQIQLDHLTVCFLDTETTGINLIDDKIIEIALKSVIIDTTSGSIVQVTNAYESFQDPGQHIEEEITLINGINDEMVKGQNIDWTAVGQIFNSADIIVAHNARFDRAFLDRNLPESRSKLWGCSISDINWLKRGFTNSKQELLCVWHGFYYASHRAMTDVDALIHLVTHPSYETDKPIVELITNANTPYFKLIAKDSAFETKDILKANKYRWDSGNKYWWKRVDESQVNDEKQWLTDHVYSGIFRGILEKVALEDKYK